MRALVLGAGGAARAAVWALREAGARVERPQPDRGARRRSSRPSSASTALDADRDRCRSAASTCSSTPPRSGLQAGGSVREPGRRISRRWRSTPMSSVTEWSWSTSSTGPHDDGAHRQRREAPEQPSSMGSRSWSARAPSRSGSGPAWTHRWKRCEPQCDTEDSNRMTPDPGPPRAPAARPGPGQVNEAVAARSRAGGRHRRPDRAAAALPQRPLHHRRDRRARLPVRRAGRGRSSPRRGRRAARRRR